MEEKNKKQTEVDDFWDISSLIPKRCGASAPSHRSPRSVELEIPQKPMTASRSSQETSSVIRRYIPPYTEETLTRKEQYEFCKSYEPKNSLLHRVTLKKQSCVYQYYGEFLSDAIRYKDVYGEMCEFEPYFSYVPQYNQLSEKQIFFYFWFRENARRQVFIETDLSYLLLYVFELINLGDLVDVRESQTVLTELWNNYHVKFPAIEGKLADWICDFSLIHQLPPPKNGTAELVKRVLALKEFYIAMPHGDIDGCAKSLLRYCSSYDYRKSKFYKKETESIFDTYVLGALREAVSFYSKDGRILSELTGEDSRLMRDSYAGALCVAKEKYRIEVEYCSFSRSNELRFLVGDIIRHTENRIRGALGIKSKMSVYSLSTDLRTKIDEYLNQNLPQKKTSQGRQEKQAYEAMYDAPVKPLSLTDARRIEQESWDTTKDLIEAFEEEKDVPEVSVDLTVPQAQTNTGSDLQASFGMFWSIIIDLFAGKKEAVYHAAAEQGKLPDALADEINEIAFEAFGDALIEETDGGHQIIEDYREMIE